MEKKSNKARQKTSQEETGVSTHAAKKRNTTIATGKAQKWAKLARTKKKSATKEHGGGEYSPENVVQEGGRIYSSTNEACGAAAAAAASRNNYDSADEFDGIALTNAVSYVLCLGGDIKGPVDLRSTTTTTTSSRRRNHVIDIMIIITTTMGMMMILMVYIKRLVVIILFRNALLYMIRILHSIVGSIIAGMGRRVMVVIIIIIVCSISKLPRWQ